MYGIWNFSAENGMVQRVRGNSDSISSVGLFHAASPSACELEMVISN